jgi:DNA-binding MarR family transcriptional regulator
MEPGELVWRARHGSREAVRDREFVEWIDRFRYTSVELLAMRFGVAMQNVRVRLKRLETSGLVRLERRSVVELWIVSLTPAGAKAIEHRPRRAPRADLHQAHELAIGWLCAYVETKPRYAGGRVLAEREARTLDGERRSGEAPRYSVRLDGAPRGRQTRWPDLPLERGGKVSALEIEFTQKTDERLQRIIDAYAYSDFALVTYLTGDPGVAAELTKMIGLQRVTKVRVLPWPRVDDASRAKVRAAMTPPALASSRPEREAGPA